MSASDPAASSSREKEIFMAALDVDDPAAQAAYLDSACAGDADLRARVERLLGLEADSRSFLQPPSMMRKGVEALEEPDFDATIQLAPAALPRQIVPPPVSASAANPDSPVPFVFGRRIAQGGMGAILEASDCKLGRTIAVKIMLSEAACSEDQKQRFIQEAAVLGRLEHPNIVPIHDLGRDSEGSLYYTMKLVKGRTLQRILDDLRHEDKEALEHYTLDRLLTIFRKVCDALAFAHAQKIIHRDLKPENIMVGEFGEVLVMDWGIAKVLGQSDHETIRQGDAAAVPVSLSPSLPFSPSSLSATLEGAVMGTPQYMSPEQALGQVTDMDARSDIFSLGGILYAILTLRPPVEGKDVWEVIEKVSTARIAAPTTFGATTTGKGKAKAKGEVLEAKKITPLPHMPGGRVPNALSAVAMKALTLDKTKRYQDIAAFSADIEAYQGGFATTAEQAGLAKQIALLIKRNKGIFTTAAAAWLLITGLAVWFIFNLRAKEQRATQAEVIAVQERETARQALAKSQLDIAEKEFHLGKFVESQKIIEETPESFRDASWRFLQAHSRDFTAQLSLAGKGEAKRLHFLPQGDRFATRCFDGTAATIGITSIKGRQIGDRIPVSGDFSGAFGMDRAGGKIAFAASANEVAVQEVATGQLVRRWACEIGEIKQVLLSPDGGTVLTTDGKQLTAYAAETGAPLWSQPFTGVLPAFSPDGQTVANLAANSGTALKIQLLDTATGAVRATIEATGDNPAKAALQFDRAGDRLACLGGDEVILWSAKTNAKMRALHFPGETVKLLSPDGATVATFSGSRIRLWDTTTGRLLRSLNGASNGVIDLAFSTDGKMLLSSHVAGIDGVVYVWPTRLGEGIASAQMEVANGRRVLFGHDGSAFHAVAGRSVVAVEARSGLQRWKHPSEARMFLDLAIHPADGSILLSELHKPSFAQVSSAGEALEAFGTSANSSVRFNRSGQLLLAVEQALDQTNPGQAFSVMEYPSGKVLRKIPLENPRQPFAAFCLDEAAVATAAKAGGITVWDWQAGKPLRQIEAAQTGSIACLAASPDGLHLATGGPDRWIRVWEAATGRLEAAFRGHWEGVRCLKFSPDGSEILSGSEDGSVRIHDATTGEEKLAFYGFTAPVADVDISADGTLITAITEKGFTQVWDRQSSSAAALLPKKPKPVLPKNADGWEDLLAPLTEAKVAETGNGWSLKNGELFSPNKMKAMLPLAGEVSATSYSLRVKLRQLPAKRGFHIVLPVADRMCGLDLEGRFGGIYTGLVWVNGKYGKNLPGTVEGKLVNDAEPHVLEITVRLDGANATITTTLDGKPLYEWTGPTAALSQHMDWATTEPGALALGTNEAGWAVSEVKLKRLEAGGPSPSTSSATPPPVEKPKPTLPKDADGWEDLLAPLTDAKLAETGHGWTLKDGELFSPDKIKATLPLPSEVSGTSYTVRVRLRQFAGNNVFHIVLPVANRMCGFELDGHPDSDFYTGLMMVNGKLGKEVPGSLLGRQVQDSDRHDLEVTVRLDGASATITSTLDSKSLYAWTGPTAALSQHKTWASKPGSLALGTWGGGWAVSEVKLKRLEAGGLNPEPKPAAPKAISSGSSSPAAPSAEKPKSLLPKDADGWEDLLAPLKTADIPKSGHEWNLKDGKLVSPDSKLVTFPMPCQVSGISYQVRAKLRQLSNVNFLHLILPVADRMCGFEIEGGRNLGGIYSGLMMVNGKVGKDIPGVVVGELINDTALHDLEVTVRLDGENATITAMLDGKPIYEWTGPTAALSLYPSWATSEPGTIAFGTFAGGWVVSEVKLKRLDEANQSPLKRESPAVNQPGAPPKPAPMAAIHPPLIETLSRAGRYAEAAQATREFIKSGGAEFERGTHFAASNNMILAVTLLAAGDRDGYRAACAEAASRFRNTTDPVQAEQIAKTCLLAPDSGVEPAILAAFIAAAQPGLERPMAPWVQLINALAEYRLGHWDAAADWATKMRAHPKALVRGTAAAAAILAMAEHQRKHPAEAAKALGTAQTAIAANWPAGTEGPWYAWLLADLLAKEAAALLPAPKSEVK